MWGPSASLGAILSLVVFCAQSDPTSVRREQMTIKMLGPEWNLQVRSRCHGGNERSYILAPVNFDE